MARINVDDSFFSDGRFRLLVRVIGDETRAVGLCVQAWFLAQRYWVKDHGLIPDRLWVAAGFEPLIEVDLAERRDDGIYCRGASEQFAWYEHLIAGASAGGKRSAEARRKKFGSALPLNARNAKPKADRSPPSVDTEAPVRSLPKPSRTGDRSLSNALTLTLSAETPREVEPDHTEPKGTDVWAAYSAAYLSRYGALPVRNAKVNGQCAQLVKRLGGDAAVAVVGFYLSHNSAFYTRSCHALGPCLHDAEALHTQMQTGQRVTAASAVVKDRQQSNADALQEALRILEDRDAKK